MRYLTLFAILLIAACTATIPSTQQYLLRSETPIQNTAQDGTAVTGIGIIKVARYIDGLGLVLETASGEVHVATHYQWAEPLEDGLRIYFAHELSAETGQLIRTQRNGGTDWKKRIDIRIDELHGTANGEARLVAYWAIFDTEQHVVISENDFFQTEPLNGDGYAALVAAHKRLLHALSLAITATL